LKSESREEGAALGRYMPGVPGPWVGGDWAVGVCFKFLLLDMRRDCLCGFFLFAFAEMFASPYLEIFETR
jgi:hypothetical protein